MQIPSRHTPLSSPGFTGRSSTPRLLGSSRLAPGILNPAFAGMTEKLPPGVISGHAKREPGISLNNLEVPDRTAMRSVRNDAH